MMFVQLDDRLLAEQSVLGALSACARRATRALVMFLSFFGVCVFVEVTLTQCFFLGVTLTLLAVPTLSTPRPCRQ